MTITALVQVALLLGILLLATKPLGGYMARVFAGERTFLSPALRPFESVCYRLFGVREEEDMRWTVYAFSLLAFSVAGLLLTYALLRVQGLLPLNPQHFGGRQMPPDLAFNTAVSFTTNTNWQSYSPEATVSTFTNMVALAIHNWMSAAAGMAVAIALVRGIARRSAIGIGNFWVDVTRATLYVLLPLGLVFAVVLVWQGTPQSFSPPMRATTLESAPQMIARGPVASQEAVKMLGTNGGGYFNANSAHPFENPTPLTNFLQMLSIFLIPAALMYTFGKMVGNTRQGWALWGASAVLFLGGAVTACHFEQLGNPGLARLSVVTAPTAAQPGGNMEGKEVRFGIAGSALFATITTDASCGAVNSMHDSFTPLGGLAPLSNILTSEVIFGGVGAGLYGLLMYAILAVFIAGLMVGRTPEYIGKKIEQYEVKMAMLAVLIFAASVLGFTAYAVTRQAGSIANPGPHGFSEILYAFSSATANNGSALAGLNANTPFYNVALGLAMLFGRFLMIVPLLAIAGSLAKKKITPPSAGTFPTDTATFAFLVVGVIVIVGALTFFPAVSLGPVVEHLRLASLR
ncbi:MAG TPA: potassium-transporting ATPase subunit KdpA [Armatimonadota bacterium]|jgi:K+-transporting ATPase ATPase A chain